MRDCFREAALKARYHSMRGLLLPVIRPLLLIVQRGSAATKASLVGLWSPPGSG